MLTRRVTLLAPMAVASGPASSPAWAQILAPLKRPAAPHPAKPHAPGRGDLRRPAARPTRRSARSTPPRAGR